MRAFENQADATAALVSKSVQHQSFEKSASEEDVFISDLTNSADSTQEIPLDPSLEDNTDSSEL